MVQKLFASIIISPAFVGLIGCSPATQESLLAEWAGEEERFFNEACKDKAAGPARLSVINMNGRSLTIFQPDSCAAQKQSSQGFSLSDGESRKPVYIHYGYAGNSEGDQLIHRGARDAIAWAQESFRVVNVSGMSIDKAQAAIMADRRRNPGDYSNNSNVFVDIDAHGEVGPDGLHRIGKKDVSTNSVTTSTYRTTDIQRALLEGVGHNAGNVVCMVQSCFSGAIQNDPAFEDIQSSQVNPQQNRVFLFAASENQPSLASTENGMEQSMKLLTQMGGGDNGLSVADFQKELEKRNLGSVETATTVYFTSNGMSTDNPLGNLSHVGVRARYVEQGPTVVGPKDALILPPGIKAGKSDPVLSESEHRKRTDQSISDAGYYSEWEN